MTNSSTANSASQFMNAEHDAQVVESKSRKRSIAMVVALPIVTALLAANIPGEVVLSPDILGNGKYGPHFECYDRMTHGWPWSYFSHDPVGYNVRSAWQIGGNRSVNVVALLFDLAVAMVVTSVMAHMIVRWWTANRYRFSLRALFVVIVGVSVALWWATSRWRLHQEQVSFLNQRYEYGATNGGAAWQPFGPLWLRELTGEEYWNWGDRLVGVTVAGPSALPRLPGKDKIAVLRINWLDYLAPPTLDEFNCLVAIRVDGIFSAGDNDSDEDQQDYRPCLKALAQCPKLAGLSLYETGISNRDLAVLATMSNLQNLELSCNERIDDQGLKHLASLKQLRRLALFRTAVSPAGVFELQKALPVCEIEWDGLLYDGPP